MPCLEERVVVVGSWKIGVQRCEFCLISSLEVSHDSGTVEDTLSLKMEQSDDEGRGMVRRQEVTIVDVYVHSCIGSIYVRCAF